MVNSTGCSRASIFFFSAEGNASFTAQLVADLHISLIVQNDLFGSKAISFCFTEEPWITLIDQTLLLWHLMSKSSGPPFKTLTRQVAAVPATVLEYTWCQTAAEAMMKDVR